MPRIFHAESADQITRCFAVMVQLRPHLTLEGFLDQVHRQAKLYEYRLVCLEDEGQVKCVAGYRITENLAWGRFLYVDDLVTDERERSKGYAQELFRWLVATAQAADCDQLHLDSGVQRFGAHRFYLGQRMDITAHHFALKLR